MVLVNDRPGRRSRSQLAFTLAGIFHCASAESQTAERRTQTGSVVKTLPMQMASNRKVVRAPNKPRWSAVASVSSSPLKTVGAETPSPALGAGRRGMARGIASPA
jgi:hypothetical protein